MMTVSELIERLSQFNGEAKVYVYDDDNDRTLLIAAVDEDDADESDNPSVLIFC